MAVAIDTARLALDVIPRWHSLLDHASRGRRRFQIHRVSVHATIPVPDSEIWRQSDSAFPEAGNLSVFLSKWEALNWEADPDDDLGDAAVLQHLHQQAATVPLLSGVTSRSDHGNGATTLLGSALSASINAATQGRPLSSFHHYSFRQSCFTNSAGNSRFFGHYGFPSESDINSPIECVLRRSLDFWVSLFGAYDYIVWAGSHRDDHPVFSQFQLDVVDLFSRRTLPTSRPGKRRRTAFNQFLQVSHSTVLQGRSSRENPLPHKSRFNGVRHRPDRRTWVAEMKPPKHKTKQDFGNFKSETEAARAVDAAFHHYGKPHLLNFPDTSLRILSTRPMAPPGLDEKAKVKFVKEEAKLLVAASSPLHSTPTNSLQIPESLRPCSSDHLLSFSQISSPFSCSGPDEVDAAVSQPHPWVDLDSIFDISTSGVQTNLEVRNSVQNVEQGWDWAEHSCAVAAPPNAVNSSACEIQSVWPDFLARSPPALAYWRSPSPCHFEDEIAKALLEQQSRDDDILYE